LGIKAILGLIKQNNSLPVCLSKTLTIRGPLDLSKASLAQEIALVGSWRSAICLRTPHLLSPEKITKRISFFLLFKSELFFFKEL
jgi:hypothetical protein